MKRAALALTLPVLIVAVSFAQPPGAPHPPAPGGAPPGRPGAGPGPRGGFAPPPFPGDSTAAERDSLMNEVLQKIAGKEQMPAESVFKDIQTFKGRPAGQIPRIMNYGFGRNLAVSCYHCHAKNDWAKDEKKQKKIAREMAKMVAAINADYISKIEGLGDSVRIAANPEARPTVTCSSCHRGSIHAQPPMTPPPGGPRPGVAPGR